MAVLETKLNDLLAAQRAVRNAWPAWIAALAAVVGIVVSVWVAQANTSRYDEKAIAKAVAAELQQHR